MEVKPTLALVSNVAPLATVTPLDDATLAPLASASVPPVIVVAPL